MFTGIIEGTGKVLKVEYQGEAKRLTIEGPPHLTEVQLGDSINLNGVCLTVTRIHGKAIDFDLSQETLEKTLLGELKVGNRVNLERALRLTDRLGGHLVTGHIDGIGLIVEKKRGREFLQLKIRIPEFISRYVVQKGSIAIDGVSLTVNECLRDEIHLTLIPYTIEKTALLDKNIGDRVNVEADILGKYVEKLLTREEKKSGRLDWPFLKEHGFIKGEGEHR